tara:strand:- start:1099 stop:1290 length:192 start_codon:yes stop_codon:yes gene_type:complete
MRTLDKDTYRSNAQHHLSIIFSSTALLKTKYPAESCNSSLLDDGYSHLENNLVRRRNKARKTG